MAAAVYVVGFKFEPYPPPVPYPAVLLIRKNRPEWQRGKLNGVGGKVERKDKTLAAAMAREFSEEAGPSTPEDWTHYATLHVQSGGGAIIYVFKAFGKISQYVAQTDEELVRVFVDHLPDNVHPNLRWLIPLALDKEHAGVTDFVLSHPSGTSGK